MAAFCHKHDNPRWVDRNRCSALFAYADMCLVRAYSYSGTSMSKRPTFALALMLGAAISPVPALAEAAPTVAEQGLSAQIATFTDETIIRTPKPAIAALPGLLERARADRAVLLADIVHGWIILGFAYAYDGQIDKSLATMDEALKYVEPKVSREDPLLLEMMRRKAIVLGVANKPADARAILDDLVGRYEKSGQTASANYAVTLSSLGVALARAGDFLKGEQYSRRAVAVGRSAPEMTPQALSNAVSGWVTLLHLTAKYTEAVREGELALQFSEARLGENNDATITALNNLSVAYSDVGRYGDAERVIRRGLEIEQRNPGTNLAPITMKLSNLAASLSGSGKLVESEAVYRRLADMVRGQNNTQRPDAPGTTMINFARVVQNLGRLDEALALTREAEAMLRARVGTEHPIWARAKSQIGMLLLEQGDPKGALAELEVARKVFETKLAPNDPIRISADLATARARAELGDKTAYSAARDAIQRQRNRLLALAVEPAGSIRLAQEVSGEFVTFARIAFAAGHPDEAFEALQLARFSELDTAAAASASRQSANNPRLAAAIRVVQDANAGLRKLQASRAAAVSGGSAADVAAIDAKLVEGQAQAAALAGAIAHDFPAYAATRLPELPGLGAVQQKLGRGDGLLISLPSKDRVITMFITAARVQYGETRPGYGKVSSWASRLRGSLDQALEGDTAAGFDGASAHSLYAAMVPEALERDVAASKRLLVLGGGALQSVPLAALLTRTPTAVTLTRDSLRRAPWLIRRQAVAVPVSLSLIGSELGAAPRSLRFAGIGAPLLTQGRPLQLATRGSFGGDRLSVENLMSLPRLPDALGELETMRDALGGEHALMLTGADALKSRVIAGNLGDYGVIAFATHGLVGGEMRGLGEPALVLSPPQDVHDAEAMLLTATDIASLRLNADWVVLSACNTAAGEDGAAPTYSGLARAFVYAGVRSLLLSQWALRDDVAARLTVDVVKGARAGLGHAEALRQAQLRLIADRSVPGGAHPAAWAPFVLLGE